MAYEIKTKKNAASVSKFLAGIEDEQKRKDCRAIRAMMKRATGDSGAMWGPSIVGFGKSRYQGRTSSGEWFVVGFSPRKQNTTVYLWYGFDAQKDLLKKLGPHKTGKACLYVKRLSDVDPDALEQMIVRTVKRKRSE